MNPTHFTIVSVLYHSEKWLENYIRSVVEADYDKRFIDLVLVDNAKASGDHKMLDALGGELNRLNRCRYIPSGRNVGFGRANNTGAKAAKTEYLFFLNIDTELHPGCLSALDQAIRQSDGTAGIWECRQFPYEHPKYYDPVDMTCSWSSGACFVVKKDLFRSAGGFDPNIHLYCEDVELSWRVRLNGYACKYVPKAVVYHYAYAYAGEIKPVQQLNTIKNALYLRFKYGRVSDMLKGFVVLTAELLRGNIGKRGFAGILLSCPRMLLLSLLFRRSRNAAISSAQFSFYGTDYAIHRKGAFYRHEKFRSTGPLVSVIIRTVARPDALREALMSVANQTYENIEVIVVEDGPGTSGPLLESFAFEKMHYIPTGEKVGRCRAGNIGLANAAGEYINFLDDDDLFFADHIETLIRAVVDGKADAAHGLSFATPQVVKKKPYVYEIQDILHGIDVKYNRYALLCYNQFPIQSVLFSRKLYERHGGFDEDLTYLEDWDLWVRYAQTWRLARVDKTTTLFRVPGDVGTAGKRAEALGAYHETLYKKYGDREFSVTGRELIDLTSDVMESFPLRRMRHELDNVNIAVSRVSIRRLADYGKRLLRGIH